MWVEGDMVEEIVFEVKVEVGRWVDVVGEIDCYPDDFFFHYRVFYLTYYIHPSSYLDFHLKHNFLMKFL
jgi:hypothetical protein